jgi:LETM1 and EF-hand domain-containing protein 1
MIRHIARSQRRNVHLHNTASVTTIPSSSANSIVVVSSSWNNHGKGNLVNSNYYHSRHSHYYGDINWNYNSIRHFSASASQDNKKDEDKDNAKKIMNIEKASKEIGAIGKELEKKIPNVLGSIVKGVNSAAVGTWNMIRNPASTWKMIKEEAHHYWIGSKLLVAEIQTAANIVGRLRKGHEMTRREREHLKRTAGDIFRLVPFSIFVIVPFMEFLLPFALKLFPNMLPSTFQDQLKKEEDMKKELQMRLAMAGFLHETLEDIAKKRSKKEDTKDGEASKSGGKVVGFLDKLKMGEPLPNHEVLEIASLFRDELLLPNMARPQLISMCRYMCLPTYGSDSMLRFQLRNKMKAIKEDDRRILWEGIDQLTLLELRDACRDRGMRAHGLNQTRYQKQLKDWLELSIQKNVPISLLIMSRAFMLASPTDISEDAIKTSINALDKATINEVVLNVASTSEEQTPEMKQRKLESVQYQREVSALPVIQ